ncbi:MAG: formate dehydrogenase accessory sulfurtransferase FdhD [Deltaproteobacteria bacterium]|nr:formate dehydrogenase accessory sulfurtransferase FdhD [Deltaproteobacteria bacterium]
MTPENVHKAAVFGGDCAERIAVLHCTCRDCRWADEELIGEEPLLIRVEARPYAVIMRTPGEEDFHAAGFCLTEGLVDRPEDITSLCYCDQKEANAIDVALAPARQRLVRDLLERRGFVSQTSCGLCGKELIEDLCQRLLPSSDAGRVSVEQVLDCVGVLSGRQRLYGRTRGSHAAALFDTDLEVLAVSEDVGRHNALDKAIGRVFVEGSIDKGFLGVLSSRISYELVQKAARARLAMLVGMSRPTALAVALAGRLNMTLACAGKDREVLVFCGRRRLLTGKN